MFCWNVCASLRMSSSCAQAAAVADLLDDPARGEAIGAAARARVEARYAWDARLAPLDAMLVRV